MKDNIKKIFNKTNIKKIIISLILLILLIIVIINLFFLNKDLNTKTYKEEKLYIYFGTEKFNIKGNLTLNHDKNITNLKINNKSVDLSSEPIYYKNKKKLILPVNYSLVNTKVGQQNKVSYYTELENIDNDYYLKNKELNYKLNNNFLYDGKDMYIFIQKSSVSFGNNNIEISPLSFVNYIFDTHELYIYNYEKDEIKYYENVNDEVIVSNDNYKINLSSDNMLFKNKQKLLMKNLDYLKKLSD